MGKLSSRAGRIAVHRARPDLCERAERELGLADAVFRRFPEGDFVAGDRNGQHLLYHLGRDGWTLIRPSSEPVGSKIEQGRLL